MLYTIGIKTCVDNTKKSGLYAFNRFGLPFTLSDDRDVSHNETYIYVFNNVEDAQKCVKFLSKTYRKEFRLRAEKNNCSIDNFGFYILKTESSKFKYEISDTPVEATHAFADKGYDFPFKLYLLKCNR